MQTGRLDALNPKRSGMSSKERFTFNIYMLYQAIDGVMLGVVALTEIVLIKSLGAKAFHVGVFFQLSSFLMPLSIFLTWYLSRIKNKKKVLINVALFTRIPLLFFAFFPPHVIGLQNHFLFINLFLLIFLLYYFAIPIILPIINLFLKSNYKTGRFGILYSYSLSLNQMILFVCTLVFGAMLNKDPDIYRYVYPVMGVLGVVGIYLITLIPYEEKTEQLPGTKSMRVELKDILNNSIQILKNNRAFRDFQLGMMLYGVGFFFCLAIIPMMLSKYFQLSYAEIAIYKDIPVIISVILFPFAGLQMDKKDPRLFAIRSFTFIGLFFLCLLLAQYLPWHAEFSGFTMIFLVILGYILFGIFSSSMTILWSIGSTYFAKTEDAATYHAIHLSFTGIRGCIIPFFGVWVFYAGGYTASFAMGILFEALAIYVLVRSMRKRKLYMPGDIHTSDESLL